MRLVSVDDYQADYLHAVLIARQTARADKTYRSPEHYTLRHYGFCLERGMSDYFYEIHNEKKFELYLIKFGR